MPNPILDDLRAAVTRNTEVDQSAIVLINGIAGKVEAAVTAALANGATEAELAPIVEVVAAFRASNEELAAAVAAGTTAARNR